MGYDPEDAADRAESGEPMPENMTYEEWKAEQATRTVLSDCFIEASSVLPVLPGRTSLSGGLISAGRLPSFRCAGSLLPRCTVGFRPPEAGCQPDRRREGTGDPPAGHR